MHTIYSDGKFTLDELVQKPWSAGLISSSPPSITRIVPILFGATTCRKASSWAAA